jgi:hypothetical protein
MQHPPSASQLLTAVAELLNDEVLPVLSGPVQHKARVAASLVSIIEREIRLGPDAQNEEQRLLDEIFDLTVSGAADPPEDLYSLRSTVATQLRNGAASEPEVHAQVWERLMQIVRADLSIAKPGYDSWDGV